MNPTPLLPVFASSSNPTQISTTVTGVVIGASSLIIAGAMILFHVTLTADNITILGTDLGMVAGAIWFLVGLTHKVINKFGRIS